MGCNVAVVLVQAAADHYGAAGHCSWDVNLPDSAAHMDSDMIVAGVASVRAQGRAVRIAN
jgi:hypothetical protein